MPMSGSVSGSPAAGVRIVSDRRQDRQQLVSGLSAIRSGLLPRMSGLLSRQRMSGLSAAGVRIVSGWCQDRYLKGQDRYQ